MACCMTVRDCAPYLPNVFKNLDRMRQLFVDFTLIVAYDNCMDESEELLKEYQAKCTYPVYLFKVENKSKHRTFRIAKARNVCLEKLETLDVDFHFMIDADDVNMESWNITLLKHYLSRADWDALSFNRKDYYDIWALMYSPFKHHCWGFGKYSWDVVRYMKQDIQYRLERCDDLFECDSAFNGFSIYRTPLFRGLRYDGEYKNLRRFIREEERKNTLVALAPMGLPVETDETFVQSCEHLYYHLSAKQRHARICISRYSIS